MSIAFGLRFKEVDDRPSMGSVGDHYDNALCESFFATLEYELLDQKRFKSQAEAKMAVFDFIEVFYNPHRRHWWPRASARLLRSLLCRPSVI